MQPERMINSLYCEYHFLYIIFLDPQNLAKYYMGHTVYLYTVQHMACSCYSAFTTTDI